MFKLSFDTFFWWVSVTTFGWVSAYTLEFEDGVGKGGLGWGGSRHPYLDEGEEGVKEAGRPEENLETDMEVVGE